MPRVSRSLRPSAFCPSTMWRILQTRPFQRLCRVRQLGFSEFIYPSATHTRFAHSVGVFHIARRLMAIIQRHLGSQFSETKARRAMAAALVHDLGHGPFSHAFEDVGKKPNLKMASHEAVGEQVIRNGEVAEILNGLYSGFAPATHFGTPYSPHFPWFSANGPGRPVRSRPPLRHTPLWVFNPLTFHRRSDRSAPRSVAEVHTPRSPAAARKGQTARRGAY